MPATRFLCPNGETVKIEDCLKKGGCRFGTRCATRPFLRLVGYDREWKGVTPSAAGNGPRYLYLKATVPYVVDPNSRAWASFGTGTHGKLSIHKYTFDVLSEETLSDGKIEGIADCLDESETREGYFDLYDYKTWGSYKLMKALGGDWVDLEDQDGNPILYVRGPKKGTPKKGYKLHVKEPDLLSETYQLNAYRILFEKYGFPIDKMWIQAIPRDGGTQSARSRQIERNLYLIPIKRLPNNDVLLYYQWLAHEVSEAFETGWARKCNKWESWDGRRCEGYCEVVDACKEMGE